MNSLSIFRGDDTTINIAVTDSDGVAVDITGFVFWFTAKSDINDLDSDAVIQKEVTSHSDPAGGLSAVILTNSDTAIDQGNYYYDIQMVDDKDKKSTLVKDNLKIKQDVTLQ